MPRCRQPTPHHDSRRRQRRHARCFPSRSRRLDPYGNIATGYTGTVHFTKSDSGTGSAIPGNYPFVAGDQGVHVFTNGATLVTGYSQTISAADVSCSSISGTTSVPIIEPFLANDVVVYRVGDGDGCSDE